MDEDLEQKYGAMSIEEIKELANNETLPEEERIYLSEI